MRSDCRGGVCRSWRRRVDGMWRVGSSRRATATSLTSTIRSRSKVFQTDSADSRQRHVAGSPPSRGWRSTASASAAAAAVAKTTVAIAGTFATTATTATYDADVRLAEAGAAPDLDVAVAVAFAFNTPIRRGVRAGTNPKGGAHGCAPFSDRATMASRKLPGPVTDRQLHRRREDRGVFLCLAFFAQAKKVSRAQRESL